MVDNKIKKLTLSNVTPDHATQHEAPEVESIREAGSLIARVQEAVKNDRRGDALDLIYNSVDELLLAQSFDRVRWIFRAAETAVNSLPVSVYLALLTISRPWRASLKPERESIAARILERLRNEPGTNQATEIVRGLL